MGRKGSQSKAELRECYERACSAYLTELARMWGWDLCYGFWVGGEIGGVYCYGDNYNIDVEDIIYCVDNDVKSDEYLAHTDYWLKCDEYNFNKLSLKAWHEGAPRIPQEVFDKLDALKKNLEDEIDNVKKQF